MQGEEQSICRGFRCKCGCFHIVWGSVVLSLTQDQFLVFADVINQMYSQLQAEVSSIRKYRAGSSRFNVDVNEPAVPEGYKLAGFISSRI